VPKLSACFLVAERCGPPAADTARNLLVETHLKLVPPIARGVHRSLPPSFELDDLIGEGNVGLMHAAARYEPKAHGGTPFSAYAKQRIHGAIVDSVRRKAWLENTANPLEDAPEQAHHRQMPFLVRGSHATEPRQKQGGWKPRFDWQRLPLDLVGAIRRLPQRQQAILAAIYGEGASVADVRALFGLTATQVNGQRAAALRTLHIFMVRNLRRDSSTHIYFSRERAA
jgi:RNA polymerase sigma factor (sigma-70 family)